MASKYAKFPADVAKVAENLEWDRPISHAEAKDAYDWCHQYVDEKGNWTDDDVRELCMALDELIYG